MTTLNTSIEALKAQFDAARAEWKKDKANKAKGDAVKEAWARLDAASPRIKGIGCGSRAGQRQQAQRRAEQLERIAAHGARRFKTR